MGGEGGVVMCLCTWWLLHVYFCSLFKLMFVRRWLGCSCYAPSYGEIKKCQRQASELWLFGPYEQCSELYDLHVFPKFSISLLPCSGECADKSQEQLHTQPE